MVDLTGKRFGMLLVLERAGSKNGHAAWLCKCDCGKEKVNRSGDLVNGKSTSCGCLHNKEFGKMRHIHGMTKTRLYVIWTSMKNRCNNPNTKDYKQYGGRGITVCAEWQESFSAFHDWAMVNGYNPNAPRGECTIDRIDVNGDYCPDNCRWATMTEQNRNKRRNKNDTN
jgi:hypothetical protein